MYIDSGPTPTLVAGGLGLAAVKAGSRSESGRIDADRRRRGNLVDGQAGAVDDREGAVRVPEVGAP